MFRIHQVHRISAIVLIMLFCPDHAGAEMQFAKATLHAGTIRTGLPATYQFPFRIDGKEPVEIIKLRPGCGCLKPRVMKRRYLPGEKGSIELRIDTLGESAGRHRWYLYVTYRQGGRQTQTALQVLANVVTEVTVQPAKIRAFVSGKFSQQVRLTDLRDRHLSIKSVNTTCKFVKPVLTESGRNKLGNWQTIIRLHFADNIPPGRHQGTLNIYTHDAAYSHLQIPIHIIKQAKSRFRANPASIKVIGASGRPLPSRLIAVSDTKDDPVVISNILTDDPAIQCRWAKGPGTLATVKVQVDRSKMKSKRLDSAVHIHIDSPQPEVITVPVHCLVE